MFLRLLIALFLTVSATAAERPGVILITVEGLGWGDLSACGKTPVPTPHLDQLLAQSAVFRDFHVSPLDAPSRSALLTGLEPFRAGVWGTHSGRQRLRGGLLTVASHFKSAGYTTALFGTWALGDAAPSRPQDHGYTHILTHPGSLPGNVADFLSNDGTDDIWLLNGEATAIPGSWCDAVFGSALTWLEKNSTRPFFCHLAPSVPAGMAPEKVQPFRDRPDVPNPARTAWIAEMDSCIGKLLDHLEKSGRAANTVVILTSTTGMPGPGGKAAIPAGRRGIRGTPLEAGHRVPLLIRWPGGGLTAGNVTASAAHYDLLPTIAALTGSSLPHDFTPDGISLAPFIQSAATPISAPPAERVIILDAQEVPVPLPGRQQCVISGPWRLINGRELYDLRSDPAQQKNVAAAHSGIFQRLSGEAVSWWQKLAPENLEPVRAIVGGPQDPVLLTPHDWLARGLNSVTREDIIAGVSANGRWVLDVAEEGNYDILLRRWPLTVNRALQDSFFVPEKARIRFGSNDETKPVPPGATGVNFRLALKPGPAALQTWFTGQGKNSGAFFVEIRRAVEVRAAKPVPQ